MKTRDTMDPDGRTRCFQSTSGFRMWGGEQRPPAQPVPFAWISLGLVVGLAILVGTWFAIFR
jgi:hypothetical protein